MNDWREVQWKRVVTVTLADDIALLTSHKSLTRASADLRNSLEVI